MEKLFLLHDEIEYTYDRLLADLKNMDQYNTYLYIKGNEPYSIFLKIIHSLVHDYSIEVLDGDFSETELQKLDIELSDLTLNRKIDKQLNYSTFNEVIKRLEEIKKWHLTLYTSGTTGRPKKVSHTFDMLTRNVKTHEKFNDDVWAFAFNPTHMAGLQVFFQALLNQNSLIYIFGKPLEKLSILISQYQITSISATPTFYRNIIPYLRDDAFPSIKQLTFGGEQYEALLEEKLSIIFPNAKIKNIYASTEVGSLFTAHGDVFEIGKELHGLIDITDHNELLIHQSLLGESASFKLQNEWFYTGDLVEIIDETNFKIISRQSDMINIGGYKVNPIEVETILSKVPGVKDIVVKGRNNSVTGEIIVADVIKSEEIDSKALKKEIKQFASTHLQQWKVPRIIKFVDELPMTRTGKKVRK